MNRRLHILALIAGAALSVTGLPGQLSAQEELGWDPALAGLGRQLWVEQFPCSSCHGAVADGVADIPQEYGPSLRNTLLSPEQVAQTIQCGRPGTGMPYFDPRAYTDGRCYGLTEEQLGDQMPPHGTPGVIQRSTHALVAFLFEYIVDQGEPTYEQCIEIWGEGAGNCDRFPSAAQVEAAAEAADASDAPMPEEEAPH